MIDNFKKFRNIEKMITPNNGNRTLFESIAFPEVELALNDWLEQNIQNCILIGGVALSYYIKPRTTQDVDILFMFSEDIPKTINKFKRHRKSAFQHNKTHVEVEVVTPKSINMNTVLAQEIFDTSIISDGAKIASSSGLVATKLGRFSRQDQADIEELIKHQKIDLSLFTLTKEEINNFLSIKNNL